MRGELFVLAVVCVSFVQVRGDESLNNVIQEAIRDVRNILFELDNDSAISSYVIRTLFDQYKARNEKYWEEAPTQAAFTRIFFSDMATYMKREVYPVDHTIFSCIDKVRDTFTQRVNEVTTEFRSSLKAEHLRLLDLQKYPLKDDAEWAFLVSNYEFATFEMRFTQCTDAQEVSRLVRHYRYFSNMTKSFARKVDKEFRLLLRTYDEKEEQLLRYFRETLNNFKTQSVAEMKKCVYPKVAISGRTAFLQLITAH